MCVCSVVRSYVYVGVHVFTNVHAGAFGCNALVHI